MEKLLVMGEIIWDVYPDRACIGGAALNFAAHASRCGAEVLLLSAVGEEELGMRTRAEIKRLGLSDALVQAVDAPTGRCDVTLDAAGIPCYRVARGVAYDRIGMAAELSRTLAAEDFSALYFGTLIQREEASRATLRDVLRLGRFGEVFCDVNLRKDCYDADSVLRCLSSATILKISEEEEPLLRVFGFYSPVDGTPENVARAIVSAFPQVRVVVLTCGAAGAYGYRAEDDLFVFEPAHPAPVVSTVGAGDSFGAAFLVSYLRTRDLALSMRQGAARSAFVVAHDGAIPEE